MSATKPSDRLGGREFFVGCSALVMVLITFAEMFSPDASRFSSNPFTWAIMVGVPIIISHIFIPPKRTK